MLLNRCAPKVLCSQTVLLINLSHFLTMVECHVRLMLHPRSILRLPRTSKLLDRSLSPAIWPPSWCSTNLLFYSNHVKFYMIKTQNSSRCFDSQKLGSKFLLCRSRPFYPFGRVTTRRVSGRQTGRVLILRRVVYLRPVVYVFEDPVAVKMTDLLSCSPK